MKAFRTAMLAGTALLLAPAAVAQQQEQSGQPSLNQQMQQQQQPGEQGQLSRQNVESLLNELEQAIQAASREGDRNRFQSFVQQRLPEQAQIWIRNDVRIEGESAITSVATLNRNQLLALGRFGSDMGAGPGQLDVNIELRDFQPMDGGQAALVRTRITEQTQAGQGQQQPSIQANFDCDHVLYVSDGQPQIGVTSCEGQTELGRVQAAGLQRQQGQQQEPQDQPQDD